MSLNLPNLSNLTETAQKNLTAISNKISIQKKIIEKERAVLDTKGDTYLCSRARGTLANKKAKLEGLEQEYERKKNQLESEIEIQEKIIWDETHKETPSIIRANMEIQMLTKEKEKLLNAVGVFTTEQPSITQPAISLPPPHTNQIVCETPQENQDAALDFALFMMDGRQDGQPIDPNPSYLSGVALGLCMTKSDKVKKGVKMP